MNYNHRNNPNYFVINTLLKLRGNGSGNPESAWVPNVNSPEGVSSQDGYASSINPSDIPPTNDDLLRSPSNTPFVGDGHQLSPRKSSLAISQQSLLKRKTLGRSSNV